MKRAAPELTVHVIDRWIERVEPGASRQVAISQILGMLRLGSRSPRTRRWLRHLREVWTPPGTPDRSSTVYCYWDERPGVALVIVRGRVTTVLCKGQGARRLPKAGSRERVQ